MYKENKHRRAGEEKKQLCVCVCSVYSPANTKEKKGAGIYAERKTESFFLLRTISKHLSDSRSQHAPACHCHDRCSKIEYRFQ